MDQRDEWKVITLTWRFSAISILAHCRGNHPTLKHSLSVHESWSKANVWWGMCVIFRTMARLEEVLYSHCTVLTKDIKTSDPDHVLSLQSYPAQTACFPCQTTRGWGGWGNSDHWPAAIIPALRRLKFTPERLGFFFLYMLLLLSFGFYKLEWKTACVKTRY